jgi:hypothetical protein
METLVLKRKYKKTQTEGTLKGKNINLVTIELPDKDNKRRESCIPEGEYKVVPRTSPKYKKHYEIKDVKNRSAILIHTANYARELLGCIGVGLSFKDLDKDGNLDIISSRIALDTLLYRYPEGFILKIVS